jgi:hypothetical protein
MNFPAAREGNEEGSFDSKTCSGPDVALKKQARS